MYVDFPSEIADINDTDFDILRCLYENGSLWKMEVTRKINSRRDGDVLLDLKDSISKQAVAKRIERLHELDYLESSIISVERKGSKQFILGYSPTGKGEEVLLDGTRLVLRNTLSKLITSKDIQEELPEVDSYLSIYSDLSEEKIDDINEFVAAELQQE